MAFHFTEVKYAGYMSAAAVPSKRALQLLVNIATLGRDYADMKMRTDGFVTPSLIGICPEGYLVFAPEGIMSSNDRAFFDLSTKLICSAYSVVGAAIVIESLVNPGKPIHGGTSVLKKNAPETGLLIISETRKNNARTMFNVVKDEEGHYLGFKESESQEFHISSGRYSNFVPLKDFGDNFRREARTTIEHMKLDFQIHQDNPFQS